MPKAIIIGPLKAFSSPAYCCLAATIFLCPHFKKRKKLSSHKAKGDYNNSSAIEGVEVLGLKSYVRPKRPADQSRQCKFYIK